MHGTVFDSPNELFTEDAPGGLEMKFEEAFFAAKGQPIFGMFAQSGGGDASPRATASATRSPPASSGSVTRRPRRSSSCMTPSSGATRRPSGSARAVSI
ncbi:hypothetical protein [Nannocystis pusilla]|uniref:hypothetical protein n=1 Tax=Nannocystis pusilla TaxID=889268 RepID=UPI003B7E8E53